MLLKGTWRISKMNHLRQIQVSMFFRVMLVIATVVSVYGSASGSAQAALPTQSPVREVIPVNGTELSGATALADINGDGVQDIIVGGRDGKVHAYTGAGVRLWEYDTGDMGISSKAAVGDIDGDGAVEIVVSAGNNNTLQSNGGLYVLNAQGRLQCSFATLDVDNNGFRDGAYSSPALVDLTGDGKLEIVFGAWDYHVRAIRHDCTLLWENDVRDTVWSSPAIGDIDRDGFPDVVIGVDTHAEPGHGTLSGGRLHVYNRQGVELSGFPIQIDEVIFSSPALGDIDNDGWLDIVVGTGDFWGRPDCGHPNGCTPGVGRYVSAWSHLGVPLPGWPQPTTDVVFASPALADLDGDGVPEVVVNTRDATVHAWSGDGSTVPGWPVKPVTPAGVGTTVSFATDISPIIADVDGDSVREVLLPSNWEVVVWNKAGTQLTRNSFPPPAEAWDLSTDYSVTGNPALGDIDGDGLYELVSSGATTAGRQGQIYIWQLDSAPQANDWHSFRQDERNNGQSKLPVSVTPVTEDVFLLHPENGGVDTAVAVIRLRASESAEKIDWTAEASMPALVQVDQVPNLSSPPYVDFTVRISTATLPAGKNDLGTVQISGNLGGQPIPGTPLTVPLTVYVGDILYLPTLLR